MTDPQRPRTEAPALCFGAHRHNPDGTVTVEFGAGHLAAEAAPRSPEPGQIACSDGDTFSSVVAFHEHIHISHPEADIGYEYPASPETPEPAPGLDVAWARAEAALPEGWTLELGNWQAEPHRDPRLALYEATAGPYSFDEQERVGRCIGRGDTPAAALLELTGCLASREETP